MIQTLSVTRFMGIDSYTKCPKANCRLKVNY